jgi:hypothetical protein
MMGEGTNDFVQGDYNDDLFAVLKHGPYFSGLFFCFVFI